MYIENNKRLFSIRQFVRNEHINSLTEWQQKITKIWQIQLNLEYTKTEKNIKLSFKVLTSNKLSSN